MACKSLRTSGASQVLVGLKFYIYFVNTLRLRLKIED